MPQIAWLMVQCLSERQFEEIDDVTRNAALRDITHIEHSITEKFERRRGFKEEE